MIDIMFIGQNVGISGFRSRMKHIYQHFLKWGKVDGPISSVKNDDAGIMQGQGSGPDIDPGSFESKLNTPWVIVILGLF